MASLQQIKTKISSVKGTSRIMSAMKLISAVKLKRAQDLLMAYRPFSDAYQETTLNVAKRCDPESHPLLRKTDEPKKLHLVFITSDRGLCGSFNSSLIRKLETYIVTEAKAYEEVTFSFLGRRGREHFGKEGFKVANSFIGITDRNYSEISEKVSEQLTKEFIKGDSDEVVLVYNYFKSALTQEITYEKVLPIEVSTESEDENLIDYLYEPTKKGILSDLLPKYIQVRIQRAIQESMTSEHASRMTAMENATSNANDVIKNLTLQYNKTRQAMITTELMDIVNGTEALSKGDD
ncbi:MAG: ATP synthase F1 subunit gamma [Thermodesulfobacteriota bacterium]